MIPSFLHFFAWWFFLVGVGIVGKVSDGKVNPMAFVVREENLHHRKLTWQWKNKPWMKMYLLLEMVIFHCHVSFQGDSIHGLKNHPKTSSRTDLFWIVWRYYDGMTLVTVTLLKLILRLSYYRLEVSWNIWWRQLKNVQVGELFSPGNKPNNWTKTRKKWGETLEKMMFFPNLREKKTTFDDTCWFGEYVFFWCFLFHGFT